MILEFTELLHFLSSKSIAQHVFELDKALFTYLFIKLVVKLLAFLQ